MPSESRAGLGKAAELSPLETAVPSWPFRDVRSASPDMFPTDCWPYRSGRNLSPMSVISAVYRGFHCRVVGLWRFHKASTSCTNVILSDNTEVILFHHLGCTC